MLVLDKKITDLKVLIPEEAIQTRIKELGKIIDDKFKNADELYIICVLKGSVIFCSDLAKQLKLPVQMEFIRISSYGNETRSTNNLKAIDLTLPDLHKKCINC